MSRSLRRLLGRFGLLGLLVACAEQPPVVAPVIATPGPTAVEKGKDPGPPLAPPAPHVRFSDGLELDGLRGHVVVVHFFASWCEPCKRTLPELRELTVRFAPQGLVVVLVGEDDDAADGEKFAADLLARGRDPKQRGDLPITVVHDQEKAIGRAFELGSMPSTYVVDQRGGLVLRAPGYREGTGAEISAEVDRLVATP